MSRKTAREVALKIAFCRLMGGENEYEMVLEQSGAIKKDKSIQEDRAFAEDIVTGVFEHAEMLDEKIAQSAIGWALDRMPKVDLCILRIAVYEMCYRSDIPHSVSINEAVELAKLYSGEKSPVFINGLLGTIARQLQDQGQSDG